MRSAEWVLPVGTAKSSPPATAWSWVASSWRIVSVERRLAAWLVPGESTAEPARSAWCHGEPGVAVALWSAAQRLGEPIDEWRALAADSARRPFELCRVEDPGLCHGAVGLAHLYNRCYQASGDAVFRDASIAWFERALAMREPDTGIGGFRFLVAARAPGESPRREPLSAFLEGAFGVGLCLLAATSSEEPGWDRLLACDLPPQ